MGVGLNRKELIESDEQNNFQRLMSVWQSLFNRVYEEFRTKSNEELIERAINGLEKSHTRLKKSRTYSTGPG